MKRSITTMAAALAASVGLVLSAAPATAASTLMSNSVASVANIIAATTCSGSVLGSSKIALKPGQSSYQFGAGMYIPTGRRAKMYENSTYVRTVTGPYTQCAGGSNWRAQVTS